VLRIVFPLLMRTQGATYPRILPTLMAGTTCKLLVEYDTSAEGPYVPIVSEPKGRMIARKVSVNDAA
jgi:hypothetical protein